MVRKMETITIHFVWKRLMIRGLINAEMIVRNEIDIDTYPA